MNIFVKLLVAGGVFSAPLIYVISSFNDGAILEIKDVSDKVGQTSGLKRIAILVNNQNKLNNGQLDASNICEGTSANKHELVGLGVLKEIHTRQVTGDGFIEGALVTLGCVTDSSSGSQRKLEAVGNPSNFWYGILDYDNVIVELLSHGIDKTKTGINQDQTIGWDGVDGAWDEKEVTGLQEFDKCYNKKLPQIGNVLKKHFKGGIVKEKTIQLEVEQDCSKKNFGASVINIYNKKGDTWQDGTSWGQFNKSYGDRLNKVKVGDGKIMIGDKDIFNNFPRRISVSSKK